MLCVVTRQRSAGAGCRIVLLGCPCAACVTALQKGVIPIVTSCNDTHFRECIDVFKFQLRERHMVKVDSVQCGMRYDCDPLEVDELTPE